MTKSEIRDLMKGRRKSITPTFKQNASKVICEALLKSENVTSAKTICVYVDCFNEVPTKDLISNLITMGKRVCVPLCDTATETVTLHCINTLYELKKGAYGILEPRSDSPICDVRSVDAVIVPGLAFDRHGNRVGFGKGYYDKLLSVYNPIKIGVCYDFQLIESIPTDKNDIKMNYIITEKGFYKV